MLIPIACVLIFILTYIYKKLTCRKKSLEGKHVFITGGSSGIGKALAMLTAQQGAHVTIVARDIIKLKNTENDLKQVAVAKTQKITSISLDVTDYNDVEKCLKEVDKQLPIYMLINCAGMSICGKIEDMPVEQAKKIFNINFYGTYFPTKAIISNMKKRKEGYIIITGSQASLLGIFGFSAYSASKYALRGMAEALDMEVSAYNINVTLALPPDTDTPGFEKENVTKLEETRLICESGGLFRPEKVAEKILIDALAGSFMSSIGLESFLLTTLCTGMTRNSSYFQIFCHCLLLGPFKLISTFYLSSFYKIIKQVADKKCTDEKKTS